MPVSKALALSAAVCFIVLGPAALASEGAQRYDASALDAGGRFDRFIVRYKPTAPQFNSAARTTASVSRLLSTNGLAKAAGFSPAQVKHVRHLAAGAEVISLPRGLGATAAASFMQSLTTDSNVLYVEPDVIDKQFATPNDPMLTTHQWHLTSETSGINALPAWLLADGAGLPIAVLDTGITAHPDLDTSLAGEGYDFTSLANISGRATNGRAPGGWDTGDWTVSGECGFGLPGNDSTWHGTHVAGTVAQRTNNGIGGAGVAYGARVIPVRVLGKCGGLRSDIADAIVWASGGYVPGVPDNNNPALVMNLSLGGGGTCAPGSAYQQAINVANRNGTIVVVAAGNEGTDAKYVTPASCSGVITVAATGTTTRRAYYSNFGERIDIAGPGGGVYADDADRGELVRTGFVWQAVNTGKEGPGEPGYGGQAGTSMASPHVAAIALLVQHARMKRGMSLLNVAQMRALFRETARPFLVAPDPAKPIGTGVIDAYAAIIGATDATLPPVDVLSNRLPAPGQRTTRSGSALYYAIDVPANTRQLSLRTYGGMGDLTLFVGAPGQVPTQDSFARRSANRGNSELVSIANPAAGRHYLMLVSPGTFSGVSVLATY